MNIVGATGLGGCGRHRVLVCRR